MAASYGDCHVCSISAGFSFAIIMLHLASKLRRFAAKDLYSVASAQLLMSEWRGNVCKRTIVKSFGVKSSLLFPSRERGVQG